MLVEMNLREFLDELASDSPAPGGGSVASLSGALSSGLISMVCLLSAGRKNTGSRDGEIKEIRARGDEIRRRLTELIDEDTEAYNQVMKAFKLPKDTDEEKTSRSHAVQQAFKQAVLVPAEVMTLCGDLLENALRLVDCFNPNTASDLGVAAQMAFSGMKGAMMNILINLNSIKDEAFVSGQRAVSQSLIAQGRKNLTELEEKLRIHL